MNSIALNNIMVYRNSLYNDNNNINCKHPKYEKRSPIYYNAYNQKKCHTAK